MYTAPSASGTFHVVATSTADPTVNSSADVTVHAVLVSVTPSAITVGPGNARSFSASVSGTTIPGVVWSVLEGPAGGLVDANGNYVAPSAPGTYHVLATSSGNPNSSATVTVTVAPSGFNDVGNMTTSRYAHTASLLPNGSVLVAGGFDANGSGLSSAETYDPVSKTFTSTPAAMQMPRSFHTATVLNDGTVLLAGGGFNDDSSAEIYDPVAGAFTLVPVNMNMQRNSFTATLLPDGRVLLAGGSDNFNSNVTATAEIYDPQTQTFVPTANTMNFPRCDHTATLLNSGKVLIAGGFSDTFGTAVLTGELFDPATGMFTMLGPMNNARGYHSASLLPDGTVLVAGGLEVVGDGFGDIVTVFHQGSELFDLSSNFIVGASLVEARAAHTATQLGSGMVLAAGGFASLNSLASVELYDPVGQAFSETGGLAQARYFHTATRLNSGDVLITGGLDQTNTATASAELYH
jgi:hypothetical protein